MNHNLLFTLLEHSGSIVPITDGKKSIPGWNRYNSSAPTRDELSKWIDSGQYKGYGLMMGYGNYHVIDIDQKNIPMSFSGSVFREIWSDIPGNLRSKLTVQRTMNGGEHILYRCTSPTLKSPLAKNAETGKPMVETIGPANYIQLYEEVPSGSLENVQWISEEEHELLLEVSRKVGQRISVSPSVTFESVSSGDVVESKVTSTHQNFHFVSSSTAEILRSGIDITADYQDWIRVGQVIANDTGEDGRDYFHQISSLNPEYEKQQCDMTYTNLLRSKRSSNQVTGASLRALMKQHGIDPAPAKGNIAQKTRDAIGFIRSRGFRLNEFTNKVELPNGLPVTDRDVNDAYLSLKKGGVTISRNDVSAIVHSSEIPAVNPLKEWLTQAENRADDNAIKDLLDCLLLKDTVPGNREFYMAMVRKWLFQVIAAINGDAVPRLVLVLIGETYKGKSEFFRRLLPDHLQQYYAESSLDHDKDSQILMSEQLIVNVDELGGIMSSSKHLERFKTVSSAQAFTVRAPYGRLNERLKRKAVLCGTSNKVDIIMDHDTGNSRIIPLEIEDIDKDRYNAIDRDALFGALIKEYRSAGSRVLYLSKEEREMLQRISDNHTVVNPEQELILQYLEPSSHADDFKSTSEITDFLNAQTTLNLRPQRISRELKKLEFPKERKRVSGSNLNGFLVRYIQDAEHDSHVDVLRRRMGYFENMSDNTSRQSAS